MTLFLPFLSINNILEQEYHNLSLWYCVSFIAGIVTYFTLTNEPSFLLLIFIPTTTLPLIMAKPTILRRFMLRLIIAFSYGMVISKFRTYTNNYNILHNTITNQRAPNNSTNVLKAEECIISPVQGIIKEIHSSNHAIQITLHQVKVYQSYSPIPQQLTKVRVTIPAKYAKAIDINSTIKIVAKLCRPQSSLLPGGYDFSFYAYFNNLDANWLCISSS